MSKKCRTDWREFGQLDRALSGRSHRSPAHLLELGSNSTEGAVKMRLNCAHFKIGNLGKSREP